MLQITWSNQADSVISLTNTLIKSSKLSYISSTKKLIESRKNLEWMIYGTTDLQIRIC